MSIGDGVNVKTFCIMNDTELLINNYILEDPKLSHRLMILFHRIFELENEFDERDLTIKARNLFKVLIYDATRMYCLVYDKDVHFSGKELDEFGMKFVKVYEAWKLVKE